MLRMTNVSVTNSVGIFASAHVAGPLIRCFGLASG